MTLTNVLGFVLIAILGLALIGPRKLPQGLEGLWLAWENYRRSQENLPPLDLMAARKHWRATGSPMYDLIQVLYAATVHLVELRHRLFVIMGVMSFATLASGFFATTLLRYLIYPAGNIKLIFVRPAEMLITYIKISLLAGLTVSLPVTLYEILLFVEPAAETEGERRAFRTAKFVAVPAVLLFFVSGLAFAYFVMLPFALRYLQTFGSDLVEPRWTISEYSSFVLTILFWIGVAFETPLIMFLVARLGIVSAQGFASKRKYAIVIIAVAAAIITPTVDPFNMMLVMGPLVLLYELGILLARLGGQKMPRPEKEPSLADK